MAGLCEAFFTDFKHLKRGILQIGDFRDALSEAVDLESFHVYYSPFSRTYETASAVASVLSLDDSNFHASPPRPVYVRTLSYS